MTSAHGRHHSVPDPLSSSTGPEPYSATEVASTAGSVVCHTHVHAPWCLRVWGATDVVASPTASHGAPLMAATAYLLWLGALLGAPQLDGDATLAGAGVSADEQAVLPHGRGVGDVLDVALVAPVSSSISGGGIDLFDPLQLSVHGYSWTQLHHLWGAVDLDDPAAPGQPLLQLPLEATGGLSLHDGFGTGPQLALHTPVLPTYRRRAPTQVRVRGAYDAPLGGGSWVAPGVFDREPAFDVGAPRARRALSQSLEGLASTTLRAADGTLFLLAEHLEHQHRYLGDVPRDVAQRDTAVLAFGRSLGGFALQLRAAYQAVQQSAVGASLRWPREALLRRDAQAWVVQGEAEGALAGGTWAQLAVGLGGRGDATHAVSPSPLAEDLAESWLQAGRVRMPQTTRSVAGTVRLRLTWRPDLRGGRFRRLVPDPATPLVAPREPPPSFALSGAGGAPVALPLVALGAPMQTTERTGTTLALDMTARVGGYGRVTSANAGPYATRYAGAPLTIAVLDEARRAAVGGASGQAQLAWRHVFRAPRPHAPELGPVTIESVAGLQLARLSGPGGSVAQVAPRLALAARAPFARAGWFVALRREPEALTAEVGDALGGDAAPATVSRWRDANGDGLPQPSEAAGTLYRSGGATHVHAPDPATPIHHVAQLGAAVPLPRGWSVGVRGTLHILRARYALHGVGGGPRSAQRFVDPGGDGRGERRGSDGHQRLAVRAELPAAAGGTPAGFVLGNARRASGYYGVELEAHSPERAPYFVAVLGGAYLSAGEAPFGNGPDRNDPGIVSEASAGTNDGVHAYGRYDHDRSFALKVLAGVRPLPGLSLALAGRYRDGQPFARVVVDPSLPQGAQALMATGRGGARYTFRMTFDARLRYSTNALRPFGLTVLADVYNLLGSATELDEDPRTGPSFRRALEAVPGRSGWVGLEVALLP